MKYITKILALLCICAITTSCSHKDNNNNVSNIQVTLSWEISSDEDNPDDYDADLSAFMLDSENIAATDDNIIFYNNEEGTGIIYSGDEYGETGENTEKIEVDLTKVSDDIEKIVFTATVFKDVDKNFGDIKNTKVKIIDTTSNSVIAEYNISNKHPDANAVLVAEVTRNRNSWKISIVGSEYNDGLEGFCERYGLEGY